MKKIPIILLAMFLLSGCDRQEMIYSFNHVEEASVDNEVENTESVDNIQAETERNLWKLQPRRRKSQMCIQVRP